MATPVEPPTDGRSTITGTIVVVLIRGGKLHAADMVRPSGTHRVNRIPKSPRIRVHVPSILAAGCLYQEVLVLRVSDLSFRGAQVHAERYPARSDAVNIVIAEPEFPIQVAKADSVGLPVPIEARAEGRDPSLEDDPASASGDLVAVHGNRSQAVRVDIVYPTAGATGLQLNAVFN